MGVVGKEWQLTRPTVGLSCQIQGMMHGERVKMTTLEVGRTAVAWCWQMVRGGDMETSQLEHATPRHPGVEPASLRLIMWMV